YDPSVGLDRLELVNISRASADQRAGRAGRTAPGLCVRLWSEVSHRSRPAQTDPEIRRVDLAGAALQLLALGERVETFPWLDPPNEHVVRQSLELLERLGALANRQPPGLRPAARPCPSTPGARGPAPRRTPTWRVAARGPGRGTAVGT